MTDQEVRKIAAELEDPAASFVVQCWQTFDHYCGIRMDSVEVDAGSVAVTFCDGCRAVEYEIIHDGPASMRFYEGSPTLSLMGQWSPGIVHGMQAHLAMELWFHYAETPRSNLPWAPAERAIPLLLDEVVPGKTLLVTLNGMVMPVIGPDQSALDLARDICCHLKAHKHLIPMGLQIVPMSDCDDRGFVLLHVGYISPTELRSGVQILVYNNNFYAVRTSNEDLSMSTKPCPVWDVQSIIDAAERRFVEE